MKPPQQPLFLARQSYRRRRAMDAVRMLPVVGLFLMLLPLMQKGAGTAVYLVYIFGVWVGLIVLAYLLSHRLSRAIGDGAGTPPKDPQP